MIMMHIYDMCIGYDTYSVRRYVYSQHNSIWYVIDTTLYINIKKYTIIFKNIINIWLFLYESKLKLYVLNLSI